MALFGPEQVARARAYHRPLYAAALAAPGVAARGCWRSSPSPRPGRLAFRPRSTASPWWAQVVCFTALIEALLSWRSRCPFAVWARLPPRAALRLLDPAARRLRRRPGQGVRARAVRLAARACRPRRLGTGAAAALAARWPAAAAALAAGRARLPRPARCSSRSSTASTPLADPELARRARRARATGRGCRSRRCSSPTPAGAPARPTPTSRASARRGGSSLYDTLLERATPARARARARPRARPPPRPPPAQGRRCWAWPRVAGFVVVALGAPALGGAAQPPSGRPPAPRDPRVVAFVLLLAAGARARSPRRSARRSRAASSARPTASRSS